MNFGRITRFCLGRVEYSLNHFPVVAILGCRQVGKTVLAKTVAPDWTYIDLENQNDYDRVSYDIPFFLQQNPKQVIIDEAQELPDLFRSLRGTIDKDSTLNGRYILTGSSSPDLLKNASESLAGRIAIIDLGTLKTGEIYQKTLSPFYHIFYEKLSRENLPVGPPPLSLPEIQNAWFLGGFPKPVLKQDKTFYDLWMDNYRQTYINRDIAKLFPRINRPAYQRFLMMLCQLSGSIINRSELGRAIEVNEKTIREYLKIADKTFIFRLLLSYEKSLEKKITKMPKGYIRDTGLLHFLLKIPDKQSLLLHPMVAKSFEGFVIEELSKGLNATTVTNWDLSFYRTKNMAEIDLIIDGPFGTLPIEIKLSSTVKRSDLITLARFVEENQLPFGLLINQSEKAEWITQNIFQLPVGWL